MLELKPGFICKFQMKCTKWNYSLLNFKYIYKRNGMIKV